MIIDITGTILNPGNNGKDRLGNGTFPGIECACGECDYMLCCVDTHNPNDCLFCNDHACPHSPANIDLQK